MTLSSIAIGGYVAPDKITAWLGFTTNSEYSLENSPERREEASEDSQFTKPSDVETIPTSGFDVVMVVESEQFFTSQGANAIRSIVHNLEEQDYVKDILWMEKIPSLNIFGLDEPLLPNKVAAPERFEKSKQNARDHPLINGQFLSDDCQTLLLMIRVNYLFVQDETVFTSGIRLAAEQELASKEKEKSLEQQLKEMKDKLVVAQAKVVSLQQRERAKDKKAKDPGARTRRHRRRPLLHQRRVDGGHRRESAPAAAPTGSSGSGRGEWSFRYSDGRS